MKALGVLVDSKLRWGPHIMKIQDKAKSKVAAMGRLVASTWGASYGRARQIYTTIVRPTITYGSSTWHGPKGTKERNTSTNSPYHTLPGRAQTHT
jgi:hypothetical protein